MKELSVFVDESGNSGNDAKRYLVALVFHNQAQPIQPFIEQYETTLKERGLRNIPLHMNPLMHGNENYSFLDVKTRTRLLTSFATFAAKCPFTYAAFAYEKKHFPSDTGLFVKMRRDIINFLFDELALLQEFNKVKIYYDNGQQALTETLHAAFEYALGPQAITYKPCTPSDFRLQQVADYICEIELAASKYLDGKQSNTEKIFFGNWRDFNKGHLKKIRKKRLN